MRLAIVVLAGLVLASQAHAEQVLRRGHHDETETLDPHKTDAAQDMLIEYDLFEGLVRIDNEGNLVPGVASSWETSADGLTWRFHLRPALMWSDGTALTAEDFVWSFRRALDPATASPYPEVLFPIAGAQDFNAGKVKDPATVGVAAEGGDVVFHLRLPVLHFPSIMALQVSLPLPRHVIEQAGARWTQPGTILSNGPFRLESWTPHLEMILRRNGKYWDAANVHLDTVRWATIEEDDTSLRLYRNGELDIARVPPKEVPRARQMFGDQLHTDTILRTNFIFLNVRRPPLDDIRVRQALTMAIDRTILADKILPHGQKPAEGVVPPGIEGYTQQWPDWTSWPMEKRTATARSLMREAGIGPDKPLQIEVIYTTDEATRLQLNAIRAMWQPLGVTLKLMNEENGVANAAMRDHQEQAAYSDWIADYPDALTFLSILDSRSPGENASYYNNPEYDALLDKARAMLDPVERSKTLQQAELIANQDVAIIPLVYETTPMLVSPKVRGYHGNPLDDVPSRDLSLVE